MTEKLNVQLRVATAADRPRLIELINAAFAIEEFLEGTRTDEERLAATMEKGEILLAESVDGESLGSVYMERRGRRGYLGLLAVSPAMQGRGLGRMLVEAAESRLRDEGMEAVEITVLNLRTDLPPIYERWGYVLTGTMEFQPSRKVKPGAEVHGIVMVKQL